MFGNFLLGIIFVTMSVLWLTFVYTTNVAAYVSITSGAFTIGVLITIAIAVLLDALTAFLVYESVKDL